MSKVKMSQHLKHNHKNWIVRLDRRLIDVVNESV